MESVRRRVRICGMCDTHGARRVRSGNSCSWMTEDGCGVWPFDCEG